MNPNDQEKPYNTRSPENRVIGREGWLKEFQERLTKDENYKKIVGENCIAAVEKIIPRYLSERQGGADSTDVFYQQALPLTSAVIARFQESINVLRDINLKNLEEIAALKREKEDAASEQALDNLDKKCPERMFNNMSDLEFGEIARLVDTQIYPFLRYAGEMFRLFEYKFDNLPRPIVFSAEDVKKELSYPQYVNEQKSLDLIIFCAKTLQIFRERMNNITSPLTSFALMRGFTSVESAVHRLKKTITHIQNYLDVFNEIIETFSLKLSDGKALSLTENNS